MIPRAIPFAPVFAISRCTAASTLGLLGKGSLIALDAANRRTIASKILIHTKIACIAMPAMGEIGQQPSAAG
jgi:hypothetical protein